MEESKATVEAATAATAKAATVDAAAEALMCDAGCVLPY